METGNRTVREQLIAALVANPSDRVALIALGKQGRSARHAAPTIIRAIGFVDDPRYRAMCFDALAAVLEDCEDEAGREAVDLLARAMEHPAYRRMRGKIARTLLKIGFAARGSIPVLAHTLRGRNRGSVRVPVRATLLWLTRQCWMADCTSDQQRVFLALEGFSRPYRSWILDCLLEDEGGGSDVRQEAKRLREEQK